MHRSDQFTFEELGEGVWAAIAIPGAGASSNCGIVDTGSCALVFDTSMTPRSAGELRAAARILSGKEPLEVVNSHWHLDHTLGNRVFGGCTIRSTELTRDLLGRNAAPIATLVNDPNWSRMAADVEARRDHESRPLFRDELACEAAARRDMGDSRDAVAVRLPDETFADRFIYPGHRDIMIVAGAGHSESDTILFVPDAEVMFAGDLVVNGSHPDLRSSNPERWRQALERIEKAAPRVIVPGHGAVSDVGACGEVAEYLREIQDIARDSTGSEIPESMADLARPSLWAQNLAHLRADSRPE